MDYRRWLTRESKQKKKQKVAVTEWDKIAVMLLKIRSNGVVLVFLSADGPSHKKKVLLFIIHALEIWGIFKLVNNPIWESMSILREEVS